jgi:hypothetical protein
MGLSCIKNDDIREAWADADISGSPFDGIGHRHRE